MERVVFLDRDGTINVEKNYLYRIRDFSFINGAEEAIRLLNMSGYKVVVISNQAGIARGYYTEKDVDELHCYINDELARWNAHIDEFYYCPHHPTEGIERYRIRCTCRKPGIGMFLQAERKYCIDKKTSWMIGDNKGDIQAGKAYGIKTILVETGYGAGLLEKGFEEQDYVKQDLLDAVQFILGG